MIFVSNYRRSVLITLFCWASAAAVAPAQSGEPILRMHGGGPTNLVTSLVFSSDGNTLYAGGWDQVVWVWNKNSAGQFELDRAATIRIPVGPGLAGTVNAIALSPDGQWLAVGGHGVFRGQSGFDDIGKIFAAASMHPDMRLDQGTIHVVNTLTRESFRLRGHLGPVVALQFCDRGNPILVSIGQDWDGNQGRYVGGVRLWDIAKQRALRPSLAIPEPTQAPGLAVRRTGNGSSDLSISIASTDSLRQEGPQFRIWHVGSGAPGRASDYASSVIHASDHSITGSFLRLNSTNDYRGQISFWQKNGVSLTKTKQLDLPPAEGAELLPSSLALLAPDTLAVAGLGVRRDPDQGNNYAPVQAELRLVSWKDASTTNLVRRVQLWNPDRNTARSVQVVASPDGQHLAIAGSPNHEVLLFKVADLVNGEEAPQRLGLSARRFRSASFVAQENRLGLLLESTDAPGKLVFDLQKRRTSTDSADWEDASPQGAPAVQSIRESDGRQQLRIRLRPESPPLQVKLAQGQRYTSVDSVKIPQGAIADVDASARPEAFIAIASHDRGQPSLHLYTHTGIPFRRLVGHRHRIQSLDFSSDGHWLVSATEGHTICVWNLQDIGRVLGKHGSLPEAIITDTNDSDNRLRVLRGDVDGQLKANDLILGRVVRGQVTPWQSTDEFYEFLWDQPVGQTVLVRLQRSSRLLNVRLKIGQGIDETKPLYSLMLLHRLNQPSESRWLAWSPLGPFDSSDRKIEELIGWHFNPVDDEGSSFVPLKQYRAQYYRPNLIRDLMDNPMTIPPRPEPDPPTIGLSIPGSEVDWKGEANRLVRQDDLLAQVMVDPSFPSDTIESVRLQLDEQEPQPLTMQTDGSWGVRLRDLGLTRGPHRLRAMVSTSGWRSRTFSQDLSVRFQPLPPEIQVTFAGPQIADTAEYQFAATVVARQSGLHVDADLIHHPSGRLIQSWRNQRRVSIRETLNLAAGRNQFELVARNSDVPRDREEMERFPFAIIHEAEASLARIVISEVSHEHRLTGLRVYQPWSPGQRIVVDGPQIQLYGQMVSESDLIRAQLAQDGQTQTIAGFEPNAVRSFPFRQDLELSPGVQSVELIAQSDGSPPTRLDVEIEYRPPLPVATPLPPEQGLLITEDLGDSEIELDIQLNEIPEGGEEYGLHIFVNDEEVEQPRVTSDGTQVIARSRVKLSPGINSIQVQTKNRWQAQSSVPMLLDYQPQPKVSKQTTALTGEGSGFAGVQVEGFATSEIDRVLYDSRPLSRGDDYDLKSDGFEFSLDLKQIPVPKAKPGSRSPVIELLTKSGAAVEIPVLPDQPVTPSGPPPKVEIDGPTLVSVADRDEYVVEFVIKSDQPIRRLDVFHDQKIVLHNRQVRAEKNEHAEYVLKQSIPVHLNANFNLIEVVARNDSGEDSAQVTVNRVFRPVSVMIEGFSATRLSPYVLRPSSGTAGQVRFEKAAHSGVLWMHGRVRWADRSDKRLSADGFRVHVWVNGFQQLPVLLQPSRDGQSRRFATQVVLGERDNLVEIGVPNLQYQMDDSLSFYVDCEKPIRNHRVHLLVFSVDRDVSQSQPLVEAAIRALNGTRKMDEPKTANRKRRDLNPQIQFSTPVFKDGFVYGPLTAGQVYRQRVMGAIHEVSKRVRSLAQSRPGTDVIVIYYQGAELIFGDEGFYLTTEPASSRLTMDAVRNPSMLKYYAVNSAMLNGHVEKNPGAHILLLDVARLTNQGYANQGWPNDSRAAMLRYAWLKSPGTVPHQLRLLAGMETIIPDAQKLEEVTRGLENAQARYIWEFPNALVFDDFVPAVLNDLRLGGGPN